MYTNVVEHGKHRADTLRGLFWGIFHIVNIVIFTFACIAVREKGKGQIHLYNKRKVTQLENMNLLCVKNNALLTSCLCL